MHERVATMYDLRDIQMFSKLSDHHIAEIKENAIIRSYTKESIVFYEGDKGGYFYVIVEGTVKLYKTSPKGSQIQINRLDSPAIVGEYACFEKMPYPATCEFVTDGKVAMIPYSLIYKHLGEADFSLEIIKSLTSKIMVLSALVHKETIFSSEAKVAKMLLENCEIFSKLKYNEVAAILNLTPETLSRIFKKMKKENIIEVNSNHSVKILDYDALEATVESNKVKKCTECISDFKKKVSTK
jgi:CRP/FNR family transcriptional regulator